MAISVILFSSDSSEDSAGTPAGRVILFGTIPTTIPDTTPVITLPNTQTDTINNDTPDTPPSPTYMVHHSLRLPFLLRGHLQHLVHFDVESWFMHQESLFPMVDRTATILMGR
ncbi:hypothetical protein Tco_0114381, partial [Tanacetum coccineum]